VIGARPAAPADAASAASEALGDREKSQGARGPASRGGDSVGGAASAARRLLTDSGTAAASAADQERCIAEGSAAALDLAARKGWRAEEVSSCVAAFPKYCDITCEAGACRCRWRSSSDPSPPPSRLAGPVGLVREAAHVDGVKAGMGSLLEDGMPDVLGRQVGRRDSDSISGLKRYLEHGAYVSGRDDGALRQWTTVYSSTQLDRESALKDDKEWTSRSYVFQSPQLVRWVRINLDERAYRAYGYEIKHLCVLPCP